MEANAVIRQVVRDPGAIRKSRPRSGPPTRFPLSLPKAGISSSGIHRHGSSVSDDLRSGTIAFRR